MWHHFHRASYQDNRQILQKVAIALLKAYSKKDSAFMHGPVAGSSPDSWIREAVTLTATATVEAFEDLSQQDPTKQDLFQNVIINRIIRGVLWTIHNGNAPGRDPLAEDIHRYRREDRSLECSLSSKWLEGDDIVYIS